MAHIGKLLIKADDFCQKLSAAVARKTLYVMGCFGAPMTSKNKARYIASPAADHYNGRPDRSKMINAASEDTFGFDCVNLIKGILWGWDGDNSKTYGGATYKSNGVPDVSADGLIRLCQGVSSDFSKIIPGAAVWMSGHIGVYIGGGIVIECTPKWDNCVQFSGLGNTGNIYNGKSRKWTKWGLLPWVDYTAEPVEPPDEGSPWSKTAREWAVQQGIFRGYGDGIYGWKDNITREQVAQILYNLAHKE